MKSYREMNVWKEATDLAVAVTVAVRDLPKVEQFGLAQQMRRAAVSVPSNLAEGWGRMGAKEFAYFISIALGSLAEVETQLHIAARLNYISTDQTSTIERMCTALNPKLRALKRSLSP